MTFDDEKAFARPLSASVVSDPLPCQLPARGLLAGTYVDIEPLDPALHAADLYDASHASDDAQRVWDFLPWGPWPDPTDFASWLDELAHEEDRIWYAFRPRHQGRVRGMACYLNMAPTHGTIEIGAIWFAPDMQRTRAATEALFLMQSYAMDDLAYRRLEWKCNAGNARSRAAARRLGFKFEGIFYNHMIVRGHNRDTAWYSILDREWPAVKEPLTRWLAQGNFDGDGKAKTSLSQEMASSM